MNDQNIVFQDENDQRQRMDAQDEMMAEQNLVDLAVLLRVSRGETNHLDFLYLSGRLNINPSTVY